MNSEEINLEEGIRCAGKSRKSVMNKRFYKGGRKECWKKQRAKDANIVMKMTLKTRTMMVSRQ